MRKSKFTVSHIMDTVKRIEAGFGLLIFAGKWASARPPFTNGERNMGAWTFQ
jgi:hypothetical protein